jgi:5-methylcytosine-specific restriction endonuclease McrA
MNSCLLLNADASPVSLLPLSTISWEEAIQKMVSEKAVVLEWYEDWIVHSEKWSTPVPAVMILKEYQKKKTAVRFSKHNVFLRDGFTCQYCGDDVTRKSATLDHVLPASHGGKTTFENTVCACAPCNANKGNDKKIVPKAKPYKPTYFQLAERRKRMQWEHQHPSWANYLEY